jgi:hypothetical protein
MLSNLVLRVYTATPQLQFIPSAALSKSIIHGLLRLSTLLAEILQYLA